MQVGRDKIVDFRQITGYISKMVQDRHTVSMVEWEVVCTLSKVTLLMTLRDNHPKLPWFLHFAPLFISSFEDLHFTFSALTLLVGHQEEHPVCKNWVMRCWCGYLSGARCRLFTYGPADATASANPIISCLIWIQTGFTFLVLAYQGCPEKEAVKRV